METPYTNPEMTCPACSHRYRFKDPLRTFLWIRCPNCQALSMVPSVILDEFQVNRDWHEYKRAQVAKRLRAGELTEERDEDGLGI